MTKQEARDITSLAMRQKFAACSRRLDEHIMIMRDFMRQCDAKKMYRIADGFLETLRRSGGLNYDIKTRRDEVSVVAMLAYIGFMQADIALYNQLFDEAKEVLK